MSLTLIPTLSALTGYDEEISGVVINVNTSSSASSNVLLSPKATIFVSLSFLVAITSFTESTLAHLIPFTLLHAILIP